jgi:hypothetical protein
MINKTTCNVEDYKYHNENDECLLCYNHINYIGRCISFEKNINKINKKGIDKI